jgi:hypothetical protein
VGIPEKPGARGAAASRREIWAALATISVAFETLAP